MTATAEYKARKGDIVAIERRGSSTYLHGKTVYSSTWHIGRATSVRRDGKVKTASVSLPTENGKPFDLDCHEYDRDRGFGWACLTIGSPALRDAAASLMPCEFKTADELKAAILSAQA